ncbi:MAG: extracellular solute-binding protein [Oscillospiraceae bacterium]|nr:extracellular solute-binding protein [Oscillospiraceae bacterium]
MKILSFILVILISITAFACNNSPEGGGDTEVLNGGAGENGSAESGENGGEAEELPYDSDGLDGLDFGGRVFNIHAYGHEICMLEFYGEEETGETINDSVFRRNLDVEERLNVQLNIDFSETGSSTVGERAQRNVNAGDHVYDVYFGHIMRMGQTVLHNVFMDVYELGHIDFDKPWWPEMAVRNLSYKDHAYLMVGEVNLSYLFAAYGVFFSKDTAVDAGLMPSDLYQTVMEGKWTIDRQIELARDFALDIDGDGELTAADRFGLTTTTGFAASAYMWGFGQTIAKIDNEGIPYLNLPNPLLNDTVEKIHELYFNTYGVRSVAFDNPGWTIADPLRNNGTFMLNHYLYTAIRLRDLEEDFGILPYPKLNETQDKYYSVSDGFHTAFAVPITTPSEDFNFTGAVIESLNAETYKTVVPAYYDIALQVKGARDDESQLVMDMIRDGRLVDFGGVYDGWTGFAFTVADLMQRRSADFTSYYEARETVARTYFDTVLETFERIAR